MLGLTKSLIGNIYNSREMERARDWPTEAMLSNYRKARCERTGVFQFRLSVPPTQLEVDDFRRNLSLLLCQHFSPEKANEFWAYLEHANEVKQEVCNYVEGICSNPVLPDSQNQRRVEAWLNKEREKEKAKPASERGKVASWSVGGYLDLWRLHWFPFDADEADHLVRETTGTRYYTSNVILAASMAECGVDSSFRKSEDAILRMKTVLNTMDGAFCNDGKDILCVSMRAPSRARISADMLRSNAFASRAFKTRTDIVTGTPMKQSFAAHTALGTFVDCVLLMQDRESGESSVHLRYYLNQDGQINDAWFPSHPCLPSVYRKTGSFKDPTIDRGYYHLVTGMRAERGLITAAVSATCLQNISNYAYSGSAELNGMDQHLLATEGADKMAELGISYERIQLALSRSQGFRQSASDHILINKIGAIGMTNLGIDEGRIEGARRRQIVGDDHRLLSTEGAQQMREKGISERRIDRAQHRHKRFQESNDDHRLFCSRGAAGMEELGISRKRVERATRNHAHFRERAHDHHLFVSLGRGGMSEVGISESRIGKAQKRHLTLQESKLDLHSLSTVGVRGLITNGVSEQRILAAEKGLNDCRQMGRASSAQLQRKYAPISVLVDIKQFIAISGTLTKITEINGYVREKLTIHSPCRLKLTKAKLYTFFSNDGGRSIEFKCSHGEIKVYLPATVTE